MTKTCKICGSTNAIVEFYTGVNCRCKECHKALVRSNRVEKSEQYRLYEKMRFKRDPSRNQKNMAYAKTEKGKASHAASIARRNAMHPEKRAANVILGNAVRDGRVEKPLNCSRCGQFSPSRQLHGHHYDYAQPLKVEWICVKCHALEHHGQAPEPPTKNRIRGRHAKRN